MPFEHAMDEIQDGMHGVKEGMEDMGHHAENMFDGDHHDGGHCEDEHGWGHHDGDEHGEHGGDCDDEHGWGHHGGDEHGQHHEYGDGKCCNIFLQRITLILHQMTAETKVATSAMTEANTRTARCSLVLYGGISVLVDRHRMTLVPIQSWLGSGSLSLSLLDFASLFVLYFLSKPLLFRAASLHVQSTVLLKFLQDSVKSQSGPVALSMWKP